MYRRYIVTYEEITFMYFYDKLSRCSNMFLFSWKVNCGLSTSIIIKSNIDLWRGKHSLRYFRQGKVIFIIQAPVRVSFPHIFFGCFDNEVTVSYFHWSSIIFEQGTTVPRKTGLLKCIFFEIVVTIYSRRY